MNNPTNRFIDELEASLHAITLFFNLMEVGKGIPSESSFLPGTGSLVEAPPSLKSMMTRLAVQLAACTRATEVRVCLEDCSQVCRASYPDHIAFEETDSPAEGILSPDQLRFPILVRGRSVGYVDVREPQPKAGETAESTHFTTQHKKIVKAVSSFLGLMIDRDNTFRSQRDFGEHAIERQRIESMQYAVWKFTEKADLSVADICDRVVRVVTHGIFPCAAVIARWDKANDLLPMSANGLDSEALLRLRQLAESEGDRVSRDRSVFFGTYRRTSLRSGEKVSEREQMKPLTAVIMVPLTRLKSSRGVLALGRDTENAEFTTVEKHALCITAGLITESEGK